MITVLLIEDNDVDAPGADPGPTGGMERRRIVEGDACQKRYRTV